MSDMFSEEAAKQENRNGRWLIPFLFLLSCFPASSALAVISTPAPSSAPDVPAPVEIKDIAPPVDVFPYPLWMVLVAAVLALALLGGLVWLVVAWRKNRPAPAPPSATSIALRELHELQRRAAAMEPYAFSIAVSDVLRTFIGAAKFRLPAKQQTSPEFLAAISQSKLFNEDDRRLLGRFLEKCDMIKFARLDATTADNDELVMSALTFVEGENAAPRAAGNAP